MLSTSNKCTLLGYKLSRNATDNMGTKHPYKTSPDTIPGGGHNYFESKEAVEKWIEDVMEIRAIQGEGVSIIEYMDGKHA